MNLKELAYLLSIISVLVIGVPFCINIPLELNNHNIFGDYLSLITGLAGVIITITIFVIQNASKEYSSQLLRSTFFRKKYFAFIFGYIFLSLVFFTFGSTFEVANSVRMLAFFVSIGLVFNLISMLLVASYFMNIINIITEIELGTTNYILFRARTKSLPLIGEINFSKKSESKIIGQVRPIFDTLNKSIALNQDDVATQCLNSLDKIIRTYLKKTKSFKTIQDNILRSNLLHKCNL